MSSAPGRAERLPAESLEPAQEPGGASAGMLRAGMLPPLDTVGGLPWHVALRESGRAALSALFARRLWSAVTLLAVMAGVSGVLVTNAIGQSQEAAMAAQLARFGTNLVVVSPGGGSGAGSSARTGGAGPTLTLTDLRAIRQQVPHILALSAQIASDESIIVGRQSRTVTVLAAYPDVQIIQSYSTRLGTFFTAQDDSAGAAVAVLGQTVVDRLLPRAEPIGAQIRVRNVAFRVVGVLKPKGHEGSRDLDDVVIIPFSTGQRRLFGATAVGSILIRVDETSNMATVMTGVKRVLEQAHRIPTGRADYFTVGSAQRLIDAAADQAAFLKRILATVAGATLAMGGFGIMNIMLMSVSERTREIGIRVAVGARTQDILVQFLLEALTLSLIGGGAGLGAGFAASAAIPYLVPSLAGHPAIPTPAAMAFALAASAATGSAFGLFPALRASRLDAVEALRHE